MFKKSLFTLLLASAGFSFAAPAYYVVVPMPGRTVAAAATIAVTLNAATLPAGQVNEAYSYDLNTLLAVTGDAAYNPAGVAWSITSGALPANITLTNGVLAGTPTVKNEAGSSFQVVASYKTKSGQQAYTIVVNGVELIVAAIAVGGEHTCALTLSGGVKCWGANWDGPLGDGSTAGSSTPVDVAGLSAGVTNLTAGGYHTCAVIAGGAKCWGANSSGQLGNGTRTDNLTPVDVSGLTTGVKSLSAGDSHTCAVTTSGAAKCWGWSSDGQLGDNRWESSMVPVNVVGLSSGTRSLTAGVYHTCAVTTTGGAKCWGANSNGQLGDGSTSSSPVPVDVTGLSSGVANLSVGTDHSCALTTTGGVKCWGGNWGGQLGDGTDTRSLTPVNTVGLASGVTQVDLGSDHSCALTTSGGVKCWGYNGYAQLGNGTYDSYFTPTHVAGLSSGATSLSTNMYHTCALTATGAKCWGLNSNGALGDGTHTDSTVPVDVLP